MKKISFIWAFAFLNVILFSVCCTSGMAQKDVDCEGDAFACYIDEVYTEQIARYYVPLLERWEREEYFENGLSVLPSFYYEGDPLDNVGFGFVDLDHDGDAELIIGAISDADINPIVFEIWTLADGEPVMLVQGSERNRYILQYEEENDAWYVANEASNSAFNFANYYLMLHEGKLAVIQGIVVDALADEQNPWFMAYDLDWDVSNDTPIDEETANAILESNRNLYTALEYFPYFFCK